MHNSLRVISIGLLIAVAGLYLYTDKQAEHYQKTLTPTLLLMLEDISQWHPQTLRKHLSVEASNAITDQQLDTLTAQYYPLGKVRSADQLVFSKLMSALSLTGPERANYSGEVIFNNGKADLNITLTKQNNQWLIYNLNLNNITTE